MSDDEQDEESRREQLNRELIELLNELRVVLAGVSVLLGFLLTVPFSSGFGKLDALQRNTLIFAFFATASAIVTLVMPAVFHRIRFRQDDKDALLRTSNRMALIGLVCLAFSLVSVVLLFTEVFFRVSVTIVISAIVALVIGVLWFGIPLRRQVRDDD